MIEAKVHLVLSDPFIGEALKVVRLSIAARQRVEFEQAASERIEIIGRKEIPGISPPIPAPKELPHPCRCALASRVDHLDGAPRIDGRHRESRRLQEEGRAECCREISPPLRHGRYGRGQHPSNGLRGSLVVPEEEGAVASDWPPHDYAELMAAKEGAACAGCPDRGKQVAGIERFVAHEFESAPVEIVAPRTGRQMDHSAVEAPILGGWHVVLDLELFDGIDHRVEGDLPRFWLERGDSVVEKLVDPWPASVEAREGGTRRGRRRNGHTRHERDQREEVAAIERQRDDRSVRNQLTKAAALRPQERGVGADNDPRDNFANPQLDIEPNPLTGRQPDPLPHLPLEALRLEFDLVKPRAQPSGEVTSIRPRDGPCQFVRADMKDPDLCRRDA